MLFKVYPKNPLIPTLCFERQPQGVCMNNEELAQLYINLSLKYEEDNYVECGFKQATEAREVIINKIKSGSLSKKDIRLIEPVFAYGNVNINDLIIPKKRFIFF